MTSVMTRIKPCVLLHWLRLVLAIGISLRELITKYTLQKYNQPHHIRIPYNSVLQLLVNGYGCALAADLDQATCGEGHTRADDIKSWCNYYCA